MLKQLIIIYLSLFLFGCNNSDNTDTALKQEGDKSVPGESKPLGSVDDKDKPGKTGKQVKKQETSKSKAAKNEQDKTKSGKAKPTEPGKAKPTEPGKAKPTEPGKTETETETEKSETEAEKTDPAKTEPEAAKTEPAKTEPEAAKTDPAKTEPEAAKTDPAKTEPVKPSKEAPAEVLNILKDEEVKLFDKTDEDLRALVGEATRNYNDKYAALAKEERIKLYGEVAFTTLKIRILRAIKNTDKTKDAAYQKQIEKSREQIANPLNKAMLPSLKLLLNNYRAKLKKVNSIKIPANLSGFSESARDAYKKLEEHRQVFAKTIKQIDAGKYW